MADWIGQFLAGVPDWLFLPLLILVVILSVLVFWIYALGEAAWVGKTSGIPILKRKRTRKE
jgi:hypothetical protein